MNTRIVIALLFALLTAAGFNAVAAQDHYITFTDGKGLYRADTLNPGFNATLIPPLKKTGIEFGHPYANGKWLWYDRTETGGSHGQRLFCTKWIGGTSNRQMTRDPWGNSDDEMPIVSLFHSGCLYLSDRTGLTNMKYTPTGKMGPGYGFAISGPFGACWSQIEKDKDIAYIAKGDAIYAWNRKEPDKREQKLFPYSSDGSLVIGSNRLSMTVDGNFLISGSSGIYYMIPVARTRYNSILATSTTLPFHAMVR